MNNPQSLLNAAIAELSKSIGAEAAYAIVKAAYEIGKALTY